MKGWLRDRLGRFAAAARAQSERGSAPELSWAARSAIEWLARDPQLLQRLGPLLPKTASRDETVMRSPSRGSLMEPPEEPKTSSAPGEVLTELTQKVQALSERADRLVQRDARWEALLREGYTVEGVTEVAKFAAQQGIDDPKEAARAFERAQGAYDPVVSGRGGGRQWQIEDRREERRGAADAMQMLLSGNDEEFLAAAIPAALREVRGQ
jgi:hypothetical protein